MDAYIGEIRGFCFPFVPLMWADCNGADLPVGQFQSLAAVIGTTYGGDGRQSIKLPYLLGFALMGSQTQVDLGQYSGTPDVVLTESNLPPHTHEVATYSKGVAPDLVYATVPSDTASLGRYKIATVNSLALYFHPATVPTDTMLSPASIELLGNGLPHNNMQPYLAFRYCICLDGIFPPRD